MFSMGSNRIFLVENRLSIFFNVEIMEKMFRSTENWAITVTTNSFGIFQNICSIWNKKLSIEFLNAFSIKDRKYDLSR